MILALLRNGFVEFGTTAPVCSFRLSHKLIVLRLILKISLTSHFFRPSRSIAVMTFCLKSLLYGFAIPVALHFFYFTLCPNTHGDCYIVSTEADESYEIQGFKLAVEVDFTHGSVSKLEHYAILGTDEVWIWEDGVLDIYWLDGAGYRKPDRSQISALSPIDRSLMSECILIGETSRIQAGDRLLFSVQSK